jgi:hypothetical protein
MSLKKKAISMVTVIVMLFTIMAGMVVVPGGIANAYANPTLPVTFNVPYSAPSTTVTVSDTGNAVTNGINLQNAINSAALGTKIIVQAGATYEGHFQLPNKTSGSGWIYIESSAYASLPAEGTRVSPANKGNMAKLRNPAFTGSYNFVVGTDQAAHNFRFVGIEFEDSNTGNAVSNNFFIWLAYVVNGASVQTVLSDVPHDITFDRCYVHGQPTGGIKHGMCIDGQRIAIVDSYISEIHAVGEDCQAICGFNGPGPFKIINNYIEASTENVLFGGATCNTLAMQPQNLEFRHNYCYKPLSWRGGSWQIKNLFELKHMRYALVDGNIFDNCWSAAQTGYAVLFTVVNQDNDTPFAQVSDVTFTNNIVRHASSGFQISGYDVSGNPSLQTNKILIKNNVWEDLSSVNWDGSGIFALIANRVDNMTIDHNTVFNNGTNMYVISGNTTNFVATNNIMQHAGYGLFNDGGYTEGNGTLDNQLPGSVFSKNILAGANANQYNHYTNNYYNPPATLYDVGFVNYNNGNNGDYHLTSSSPYKNQGTDGKDLGADIDAVNAATLNVITGGPAGPTPTPGTPTPTPTATPTPGAGVWYQNFEADNGFTAGTNATTTISNSNGANAPGTKSVNLTVTGAGGDPGTTAQCVNITPQSGASIDASGYAQFIFFIKDTVSTNTNKVTMVDTSNAVWSGWININNVNNQWTKINLTMSTVTGINKAAIKEIRIGEWWAGTYYVDDAYFAQNAADPVPSFSTPTPTPPPTPTPTSTPTATPTPTPTPTATPTPAPGGTLLDENFNAGTTGSAPAGWTISAPSNTTVTVAAVPSTSDKSMKIYDNNASNYATAKKTFTPQTGTVTLEWKYKETVAGKYPKFYIQSGSTVAIQMYVHEWGPQLAYLDPVQNINIALVSSDTWYTVKVVANVATDTFDVYMDNVLKLSNVPFTTPVSNIDTILFGSDNGLKGTTLYIDNVKVTN